MSEREDEVVDLESHRRHQSPFERLDGELPPGDPVEQIDAILDRHDAEDHIKTLNPHSFFRLIKQAGFDQGVDLIPYASPRQLQVFFDLDCWTKDRFDTRKMANWLAVLVSDADDDHFHRAVRDIDNEVMALFFKKNIAAVGVVEEGEIPEDLPAHAELSPDNAYAIVYPDDEDVSALLRTLIDRLYHVDQGLAWALLEAVRWELTSEMEETAYQFRTSRLEEYGFVERTEALSVYADVDPVGFRDRWENGELDDKPALDPPETIDVPTVVSDNIDDEFYFFTILDSIGDDDTVARLSAELVTLTNRTMIADGIEPGEIETGREVVRRTAGYLSLGLEFVARANDDTARRALTTLPIRSLFQVGYSTTTNLQQRAGDLSDRPTLSLIEGVPYSLLNPDETALFEGLEDIRPTFARDRATFGLFRTQDQVDQAALRIGMVAFKQLWLFGVTDHSVEQLANMVYEGPLLNEPDAVTFDLFFSTALATHLLHDDTALRGLSDDDLKQLPEALSDEPWGDDPLDYFEPVIGPMLVELPAETTGLATRWLHETLEWLVDELAPIRDYIGPEPYTEVVLVAHPEAR